MKHLRQYIRQVLLTEGMKTPAELPDEVDVAIKSFGDIGFAVSYISNKEQYDMIGKGPWGRVEVGKPPRFYGPCGGAMMIQNSEADSGWGPLLYDVAIEYATQHAGGLVADRTSVSGDARGVWDYYMQNRGDVTAIQMDDLNDALTSDQEDNCNQKAASFNDWALDPRNIETDWQESSLSKRWTKSPVTIQALKRAGKLVEQ